MGCLYMEAEKMWKDISPEEVEILIKERKDIQFIDVREREEFQVEHISGVKLIPMSELENRMSEINPDKEAVLICRSGKRSSRVCTFLEMQGYKHLYNMTGGMLSWTGEKKMGDG